MPVELRDRFTVLYTVPPATDAETDRRLEIFLNFLTSVPQRFVYVSTTGVYGDHGGIVVDEETPTNAQTERAKLRIAAEELLQCWGQNHGKDVIILRVPGIYGPKRLGIKRIKQRTPVIAEEDASPGNRIHVDDLVSCCETALSDDAPAGIYNVGDGDHRSATWFTNELARQCDLEPPPAISMEVAERTLTSVRLSFLKGSRRVSTKKMREVLGVTPRYANAEDGIAASLL